MLHRRDSPVFPSRIASQEAKLQLEAQLRYRLGQYPEAIALYRQLFQQFKAETMEVQTNVLAAYVAGGQAADVPAILEAMKVQWLGSRAVDSPLLREWEPIAAMQAPRTSLAGPQTLAWPRQSGLAAFDLHTGVATS